MKTLSPTNWQNDLTDWHTWQNDLTDLLSGENQDTTLVSKHTDIYHEWSDINLHQISFRVHHQGSATHCRDNCRDPKIIADHYSIDRDHNDLRATGFGLRDNIPTANRYLERTNRMNNNQQGRNQDADNTIWQDADTGRMLVDYQFNWMDGNTRLDNQTNQMPQQ